MATPPVDSKPGAGQPEPDFSAERDDRDAATVLVLRGELDLNSAERLLAAAAGPAKGGRLVLDLAGLAFVDSAGLRALMNLDLRARAEGWEFALAAPAPAVLRVLTLTGFDKRLSILDAPP